MLSLIDLSPVCDVGDYTFVVLKSYFDGSGKADSLQYEAVTLGCFSGTAVHWSALEKRWKQILKKYSAPYLHTTDVLALARPFTKSNGWSREKANDFISECVGLLETLAARRSGKKITYPGLRPHSVTVLLDDYKRALKIVTNLGPVEDICVTEVALACGHYGIVTRNPKYQFYFDQNEPFYGHIKERADNKKAKAVSAIGKIVHFGQSDMREVPALQAADLLAWSVNNSHSIGMVREWQNRILSIDRDHKTVNYDLLMKVDPENIALMKSFGFMRRKAMR